MQNLGLSVTATVALVSGVALFVRSFREFRVRWLIQNTPTSRIRSMAMGLVEINGTVEASSVLTAPFSGHPCAYWELDISTTGGKNRSWQVVHRRASGHPFYVRDETGCAMVYPKGAECRLSGGSEEECMGMMAPACYTDYMESQGLALRHVWRLSMMRFRERLIEEGQQIYVLGTATPRPHAVTVSEGEALQATGTESLRARRVGALQAEAAAIVRRGENERVFLISRQAERELLLDLGVQGIGKLVLGPLLALVGLGIWLVLLSN